MPPKVDKELFQEVRDELKALRGEIQDLKLDFATYKGAMKIFNWLAFTVFPAIGGAMTYFGMKIGPVPR